MQDLAYPRIKIMPHAYMEKLRQNNVLIGHERCASSAFSSNGTLIVCASHAHSMAQEVLHQGCYYMACQKCIEASCEVVAAKTEEQPRGLYVDIAP